MAVPISDLPPSETALIWLTVNHLPNIYAFARTATDVLAHSDIAAPDWTAERLRQAVKPTVAASDVVLG